jgi:hypothetical protein
MLTFQNKRVLFLIGSVILGLFCRWTLVFALPIWIDEAFTLGHLQLPLREIIAGTTDPTHPFGYYLFLKIWSLLSTNLQWLRMSSLCFYLSNCVLLYKVAEKAKQSSLGVFLVLLYALSGYFVTFDWQARMYTGVVTLILSSWYSFQAKKPLPFFLFTTLGLYFDYAFLWYAGPLTLWLGYQYLREKTLEPRLVWALGASWLTFTFWLPTFFSSYAHGADDVSWIQRSLSKNGFVPFFLGTHTSLFLTAVFLILVLVGAYLIFTRTKHEVARFFLFSGLSSAAVSLTITFLFNPIFHGRNMQVVGLMVLFSLAALCHWLWQTKRKVFLGLLITAYLVNFFLTFQLHFQKPGEVLVRFCDVSYEVCTKY